MKSIVMKEARSWGNVEFPAGKTVAVGDELDLAAAELWVGMGVADEVKTEKPEKVKA
jgi:hypothetical protein